MSAPDYGMDAAAAHVTKKAWCQLVFDDTRVDGCFRCCPGKRLVVCDSFFVNDFASFVDCVLWNNAVRCDLCGW